MTRSRDLSGFGATPQPKPQVEKPKATKPKPAPRTQDTEMRRDGRARTRSAPSRKTKRITLSLPTDIADDLKEERRRESTYYLDIILDAFLEHSAGLVVERRESPRIGGMAVTGRRKRRPSGRTQIPLVVPEGVLAEIDKTAEDLGLDRSAFVSALLERAL